MSRKRARSDSGATYARRRLGSRKLRIYNAPSTAIHKFRRHAYAYKIFSSNTLPVVEQDGPGSPSFNVGSYGTDDFNSTQFGLALAYKLKDLPEYTEFTSLFDQYRIDRVELKFMFQSNAVNLANSSTTANNKAGVMPIMYWSQDLDDNNTPTSQEIVTEYGKCRSRILSGNDTFTVNLYRPGVSRSVFQGLVPAYEMSRNSKIDIAYPEVLHFGHKFWFRNWFTPQSDADALIKLTVQPIFHFTCYNVR